MDTSHDTFRSGPAAPKGLAICIACIVASLVVAGMLTWAVWQIVKAVA